MQREEFEQQLWLDYIHTHPELGGLALWHGTRADYLTLVTLDIGPFSAVELTRKLHRMGYSPSAQYAMADKGLMIHLLRADDSSTLVLVELKLGTLCRAPREALKALVDQCHPQDCRGHNLLCRGRPWPMPSWSLYCTLEEEHPLAAWLSVMGPRVHHAGFDCRTLGEPIGVLDQALEGAGMPGHRHRYNGVFSVSKALEHRFYPAMPQRVAFSHGDQHRLCLGGLALAEPGGAASTMALCDELLPAHARCEMA